MNESMVSPFYCILQGVGQEWPSSRNIQSCGSTHPRLQYRCRRAVSSKNIYFIKLYVFDYVLQLSPLVLSIIYGNCVYCFPVTAWVVVNIPNETNICSESYILNRDWPPLLSVQTGVPLIKYRTYMYQMVDPRNLQTCWLQAQCKW